MLHLVTGRAGSGKTETVRNKLGSLAAEGHTKLLLLVPEQYSFLSERAILEQFGEQTGQHIEVLSFTRLSDYVFRELGGMAGQSADDATRIILMLRAMLSVKDQLVFYARQAESVSLAGQLLQCVKDMHRGGVTPEDLRKTAALLTGRKNLSAKLSELALITDAYEALFFRSYTDEDLQTKKLCQKLDETRFFAGYTIAVDGFKGFTGQEQELLTRLIAQADDVYLTLCTDESKSILFQSVNHTKDAVRRLAQQNGVGIYPNRLTTTGIRFQNSTLRHLEQNLFAPAPEAFDEDPEGLTLFEADTLTEECNYIAATAKKLMRERGLRCKDMAVIVRREESYKQELMAAFRRYGIPVFDDSRQPIANQPLISLMKSVLTLLTNGFTTENLLNYLKTGLSPLTQEEVATLENYALLWNLKAKNWQADFTLHPDGLGVEETEQSNQRLSDLNDMRKAVILPLLHLKKQVKETNAEGISRALYDFLQRTRVPDTLKDLAVSYHEAGFTELAKEQNTVYELLMNLFDRLSTGCGPEVLSISTYCNLFHAVVSMAKFATIPSTLDEISIGAADRVRLDNPKVVFVAGLAEGSFPSVVGSTGIFSSQDRDILYENGLELSLSKEDLASEELFIAYAAVTASTDAVYLSYHKLDGGAAMEPSEVLRSTQRCFGGKKSLPFLTTASLPEAYFAETADSTFAAYAKALLLPTAAVEAASLRAAIAEDPRLSTLDAALGVRDYRIADPALATRLFGTDMGLSASRVDVYHKCAFEYFCKFGLKAQPRKKAALDPAQRGTVIHYVLEQIIKNSTMPALIDMTPQERRLQIERWLNAYVTEKMGGLEDKPIRFQYLYHRLAATLTDVVERLVEEFKNSDFVPTDFELSIGPKGSEDGIPAYRLDLPKGGSLSIYGSIDRVDTYQKDGKTYVRVVDYKTGGKEFVLSEVVNYGINMQMLIYLFAIAQNGAERYGDIIPSGIFYYPAKRASYSMENKREDPEAIQKAKQKQDLGSGLFLMNEDLLEAMEHGLNKKFLPIDGKKITNKKGELETGLITAENLKRLQDRINTILIQMAESLQAGIVPANPARGTGFESTCTYCDYYPICRLEETAYLENKERYKEIIKLKQQDAINILCRKEETNA